MLISAPFDCAQGRLRQGGSNRLFSVVLAALPPKQPKKIVTSLLPQAKNARCGASNHAIA
jgi:hypothetical protein